MSVQHGGRVGLSHGFSVASVLLAVLPGMLWSADAPVILPALTLPAPTVQEQAERNRDPAVAVQFSPTGQYLAIGMESGHLVVWNFDTKKLQCAQAAHEGPAKLLAFGAEDRYVLSAADDLQANLWDLESGQSVLSFQAAPLQHVYDIALSSNTRFAASRGFDGFGVVWDLRVNRKALDLFSYGFAWGPKDSFLVSTPVRENGAKICRLRDSDEPVEILGDRMVQCVAVDSTGRTVACGSVAGGAGKVLLVGVADSQLAGEIEIPALVGGEGLAGPTAVDFSSDGQQLVIGCSDGRILRADVTTRQIVDTCQFPGGDAPGRVAFVGSRDRYVLATAYGPESGRHAACWRAGESKPVWNLAGAVTLDGRRMLGALVTTEGDIVLINASDGTSLRQLRGFLHGAKWLDKR